MTARPRQATARAGRPTDEGPIKVLLAEDEESFIDALMIGLTNEGFRVTVARDGVEALKLFEETDPDILLARPDAAQDVRHRRLPLHPNPVQGAHHHGDGQGHRDRHRGRPGDGGRRLRHQALPAPRAGGPHAGRACDGPREDRTPCRTGTVDAGDEGMWESNDIKMDFDQRRVFVRGEEVHLRRKEFELLRLLIENSGRVLTRDVLIDRVWGTDYIGDTKTLDVHIKRLRSRIEADPSVPVLITTVRGVGYRFSPSTN